MSYRFVDSFRAAARSGWNCSAILILLENPCKIMCQNMYGYIPAITRAVFAGFAVIG
jgi:hypothetical protein